MSTVAGLLLLAASALAQQDGGPHYIEFAGPARVPGVTLQAGMYVFVPGRPIAGQMVLDIYRADGMVHVASVLAVESSLAQPAAGSLVDYAGPQPPYIRAWFHPGFRHGYELVYAPEEAVAISAAASVAVPSAVFRGTHADVGLLPIDHFAASRPSGSARDPLDAAIPALPADGPVDHLTLARLEILAHLPRMPPDIARRLTLLNRQLADLLASYWAGRDDVRRRLLLVLGTLRGSPFPDHHEAAHVVERVRARVDRFVEESRVLHRESFRARGVPWHFACLSRLCGRP